MLKSTLLPVEISASLAKYVTTSRRVIVHLLDAMRVARSTLTCHIDGGFIAAEARVERVAAGEDALILIAASAVEHDLLAAAKAITAVGFRQGVRIQFRSRIEGTVVLTDHAGIRASLPHELLRLQRREFDRVKPSRIAPLECMVRGEADVPTLRRLPVLDISVGGVALLSRRPSDAYEVGERLVNCSFDLGRFGSFTTDLIVRNVERLGPSGARRHGCAFADIEPEALETVCEYVERLDALRQSDS